MDQLRQCGYAVIYCRPTDTSFFELKSHRDRSHCYVALKVYITSTSVSQEIEIYNHLKTIQSDHAGQSCLRSLIETFQVRNPDGHRNHTCLVHPPLGISLDQLTPLLPGKVMSSSMVRTTMRNILAALDFLHTEAQVIHTGQSLSFSRELLTCHG